MSLDEPGQWLSADLIQQFLFCARLEICCWWISRNPESYLTVQFEIKKSTVVGDSLWERRIVLIQTTFSGWVSFESWVLSCLVWLWAYWLNKTWVLQSHWGKMSNPVNLIANSVNRVLNWRPVPCNPNCPVILWCQSKIRAFQGYIINEVYILSITWCFVFSSFSW